MSKSKINKGDLIFDLQTQKYCYVKDIRNGSNATIVNDVVDGQILTNYSIHISHNNIVKVKLTRILCKNTIIKELIDNIKTDWIIVKYYKKSFSTIRFLKLYYKNKSVIIRVMGYIQKADGTLIIKHYQKLNDHEECMQ
uniref:Uncharacterized protein n=1 Tax=Dulem virus 42 TaxID=3145760 RepID=A0AAU8B7W1_9CAUD